MRGAVRNVNIVKHEVPTRNAVVDLLEREVGGARVV